MYLSEIFPLVAGTGKQLETKESGANLVELLLDQQKLEKKNGKKLQAS